MNLKSELRKLYPGASDDQIARLMTIPPVGVMVVADSKGTVLLNWVGPLNKQMVVSLLTTALQQVNSMEDLAEKKELHGASDGG